MTSTAEILGRCDRRRVRTMATDRSKWDVLLERYQKASEEYLKLTRELNRLETQECGLTCSGCGALLETEADFVRHYLVPDERFLNLGYCPNKKGTEGNTGS
jgi:hypothetical protein